MRALTGAIITAGALIGLGLTAIGIGTRYSNYMDKVASGEIREPIHIRLMQMDTSLLLCLWVLIAVAVVGLITAFVGLSFHHHRRYHELLPHLNQAGAPPRATV
jgi:hypothetical protein